MNEVQVAIIGVVVIAIIAIVAHHFYKENKYKNQISKGFNQAVDDALGDDASFVMENRSENTNVIFAKDIVINDEVEESPKDLLDFPSGEVESTNSEQNNSQGQDFSIIDAALFNFKLSAYDHVIDVKFPNSIKLKMLPELTALCNGKLNVYILENGNWQVYTKGKKYVANGLRVVIHLVGEESIVSPLQLSNVYSELNVFASKHKGLLRQTASEEKVVELQKNFKKLKQAALDLELFIVNHDYVPYDKIKQIFIELGLVEHEGLFYKTNGNEVQFYVADEDLKPFKSGQSYRLFSINSKLHHFKDPMPVVDMLFDFAEEYQSKHNSRLLSSNKVIMKEQDYKSLVRQINLHFHGLERNQIEPGSELIKAICP